MLSSLDGESISSSFRFSAVASARCAPGGARVDGNDFVPMALLVGGILADAAHALTAEVANDYADESIHHLNNVFYLDGFVEMYGVHCANLSVVVSGTVCDHFAVVQIFLSLSLLKSEHCFATEIDAPRHAKTYFSP